MADRVLDFGENENGSPYEREVQVIRGKNGERFVFVRGRLFTGYDRDDLYTRNFIIVQLFRSHKVRQSVLSEVFGLTVPHISRMMTRFREQGSAGIVGSLHVRIKNSQKIKGKVADYLRRLLAQEDRPTYEEAAELVGKRFRIKVSAGRIGNWWREQRAIRQQQERENEGAVQLALVGVETPEPQASDAIVNDNIIAREEGEDSQLPVVVGGDPRAEDQWRYNVVAGSFVLYAMLLKSQFLKPFVDGIRGAVYRGKKSVERVMLTLFFMHALRLKSVEQTKHLLGEHFGVLVLGPFYRQQSLRYAIDEIVEHKNFEGAVCEHFKNLSQQTDVGDGIYYVDGHFSCYYGKRAIPKGYDPRRKQPSRGRTSVYLHNSLGHNVLCFESPTNTTLNVDIGTLLGKMKASCGDIAFKTLMFDRGGFSADCFKGLSREEMYFATYLKHRKKSSELDLELFEEVEIELRGETIRNRIYEKARETKAYGKVRTILFIGKRGKQIPVITTNPNLSAAEIVARLQKRWVEENGFKYMGQHYNIDLLTTYEVEEAPDKIMTRPNPTRKQINADIRGKRLDLNELKEDYANRFSEVTEKDKVTIQDFERQESTLLFAIKNLEMEIGLLVLQKDTIPPKVVSNLKDECVIIKPKRRLLINLVKAMNYNCEKWLQELFCQYHPKDDETLSLIRQVLKTPGRVRHCEGIVEVELERIDNRVQAESLDRVLAKLEESGYMRLPDGRTLAIKQAI